MWTKIKILLNNRKCGQKSQFWSIIENQNFGQKNWNLFERSNWSAIECNTLIKSSFLIGPKTMIIFGTNGGVLSYKSKKNFFFQVRVRYINQTEIFFGSSRRFQKNNFDNCVIKNRHFYHNYEPGEKWVIKVTPVYLFFLPHEVTII